MDHLIKIEGSYGTQNDLDYFISLANNSIQSKSHTELAASNFIAIILYQIFFNYWITDFEEEKSNKGMEEEVIETLKEIIFNCGEKGIYLSELPDAYIDYSAKTINCIKLGYSNLEEFVYSKLQSFTRIDVHESHYEPKLFYEENPSKLCIMVYEIFSI